MPAPAADEAVDVGGPEPGLIDQQNQRAARAPVDPAESGSERAGEAASPAGIADDSGIDSAAAQDTEDAQAAGPDHDQHAATGRGLAKSDGPDHERSGTGTEQLFGSAEPARGARRQDDRREHRLGSR
jgi:hypothetical protein